MSSSLLIRRGWSAALPALIYSVEGTGSPGSPADFFIETMHFIAEARILVALIGYRARISPSYGGLGLAWLGLGFALKAEASLAAGMG